MSTARDSTARNEDTPTDPDVIINRINVSLARSQRLINSWLPPKPDESNTQQDSDEDDFKSMTEAGGIGSKTAYEDEQGSSEKSVLPRQKLSSNDKLLEQLIGKKAAQARKKDRDAGKSMSASRHSAPKPITTKSKQEQPRDVESEDEEEVGRAGTFKSRKKANVTKERNVGNESVDAQMSVDDAASNGLSPARQDEESTTPASSEVHEKSARKKPSSYLDEVLAQRGKKKKKNKSN